MNTSVVYIYDTNLELIGVGDASRFNESIFVQYYIACGYILSASKMNFSEETV